MAQRLKKSFPFVDLVFGTHVIHRLPEMLSTCLSEVKRVYRHGEDGEEVLEGLPVRRDGTSRAWVTVMVGCYNLCSYCIVPYVRGREKSREPQFILEEFRQLVAEGKLDGIEIDHPRNSEADKAECRELCRRHGLIVTGGTDFHGSNTAHPHPVGTCTTADGQIARIDALAKEYQK